MARSKLTDAVSVVMEMTGREMGADRAVSPLEEICELSCTLTGYEVVSLCSVILGA